jgi:hypothetical protein
MAGASPRDLRLAVIADADDLAVLQAASHVVAVRPEDWVAELEAATLAGGAPDVLLVTSAWAGNGGAWTYRIGWYAHPDSFLHRDLRALIGWCAERGIPSLFAAREVPDVVRDFGDAAVLFDLVLAPDEAAATAFRDLPQRRGAGVRVPPSGSDLGAVIRSLGMLLAEPGNARSA